MSNCFASCTACDLHAAGKWKPRTSAAPYRLPFRIWREIDMSVNDRIEQHWGMCDDVAVTHNPKEVTRAASWDSKLQSSPRKLYDWVPRDCKLEPFSARNLCTKLLRSTGE